MRRIVLVDDGMPELAPLTDLRAAFEVRTGALTTLERWRRQEEVEVVAVRAPDALAALVRERVGVPVNDAAAEKGAEVVSGRRPLPELQNEMTRPWHVRSFRDACLAHDLALLTRGAMRRDTPGVVMLGARPIAIDASATVWATAVLDASAGPIAIGAHAVVRPGAIIVGPAYVGEHSTVLERALVKANTAIGPHCKIGGEVGGTIFQGFANKAHDGHLGDSWVGEWVNLGAGTTNSNLLNTYGEVIARRAPDAPNERTGEQFLGAIIGDHVKTAIGTRIMTGAVIHTGAMWAAARAVEGCVKRFAWVTDEGERTYRMNKFVEVMNAVMGRRGVTASAAYLARIGALP